MAYVEPKTTWTAGNIPVASDMNRIEGNTKQNHDDIAAEAIARAADVDAEEAARIADVDAEESARISADAIRLANNNMGPRTLTTGSLTSGQAYVIPAGIYVLSLAGTGGEYQINISGGSWTQFGSIGNSGFLVSDGTNSRIYSGGNTTWSLARIL